MAKKTDMTLYMENLDEKTIKHWKLRIQAINLTMADLIQEKLEIQKKIKELEGKNGTQDRTGRENGFEDVGRT
jgi:hypothetical protein